MKNDPTPNVHTYLTQVSHRLRFPKETRKRICSDLQTTILAKLEAGFSEEEILRELGDPKTVAAEFHAQMPDLIQKKRPLRIVCLAAAILSAIVLSGKLLLHFFVDDFVNGMTRSIGIISGADGPTSVFITASVSGRATAELIIWLFLLIAGIAGFCAVKHNDHKEDEK